VSPIENLQREVFSAIQWLPSAQREIALPLARALFVMLRDLDRRLAAIEEHLHNGNRS